MWAEAGVLVVHVKDVQRHPIHGLQIGVEGDGGSSVTGADGKARISLANQTKTKSWVSLQILKSPPGKDFVMISPWDDKTMVPSFENETENFVEVVVVQRGERSSLESGDFVAALTARINRENMPKAGAQRAVQDDPKGSLEIVAKQYGLAPNEVDQAIRAWGAKTTDPYNAGLAALYEKDYPEATLRLSESLNDRMKGLAKTQNETADAAFFLGQSLFREGKYRESASVYQQAAHLRQEDGLILNNLGISLVRAGEYAAAEPILRRALAIYQSTLGLEHIVVATVTSNLADSLRLEAHYPEAELLYKRALEIDEKVLGAENPKVAMDINNLGGLLEETTGDYARAESMYRQALKINEKALEPDDQMLSPELINLALLMLRVKGDYIDAEPLCRRALAIDEKTFGTDHPEIAIDLSCMAEVLTTKGDYVGAESQFRKALEMDVKKLGPDHPEVAKLLSSLEWLSEKKGDFVTAESLLRRALTISEKTLGPDHPSVGVKLSNLALLLYRRGDYTNAEPLSRRVVAIDEKTFGTDNPEVAVDLILLVDILFAKHDYAAAFPLSQRALAIAEKSFGQGDPRTRAIHEQLRKLKDVYTP